MEDVQHHHNPPASQVLRNPDLLYSIFECVPRDPSARHSPLVGCTTVCRGFYEPAIRVLWRNLETLVVLWHPLAPSNVAYPHGYRFSGGRDNILLEYLQAVNAAQLYLDPTRWDRFLWYAKHVRRVFHFPTSQPLCDATRILIQGIMLQNGGNPILPLLRTIQWWTRVPIPDGALIPLLTPTLQHATICFGGSSDPQAITVLFRRMHESSPFLETLSIHLGPNHDALGLSQVQELVSLHRLREVVFSEIQGLSALRAIVAKPNLTNLDVTINRRDVNVPRMALGGLVSAHDLRELTLRSSDASVVSDLFKLVRFHALKTAVFHLGYPEGSRVMSTELSTFLGLFYNSVSDSDLQSFELSANTLTFQSDESSEPVAFRELLAAILPIRGLRSFSFLASGTLTTTTTVMAKLDDADICVLSTAWPRLERLSLNGRNFTSESSISLDALYHLYTHCTALQELTLPRLRWPIIGVHYIPPPLTDRPQAHSLKHISMQHSGLGLGLSNEGAEAMARYLLDLFPSLDLWKSAERNLWAFLHSDEQSVDNEWNKVVGHIFSIRSIH